MGSHNSNDKSKPLIVLLSNMRLKGNFSDILHSLSLHTNLQKDKQQQN